jgi:hypothetical protein
MRLQPGCFQQLDLKPPAVTATGQALQDDLPTQNAFARASNEENRSTIRLEEPEEKFPTTVEGMEKYRRQ